MNNLQEAMTTMNTNLEALVSLMWVANFLLVGIVVGSIALFLKRR